jgi:hypothetical protein
MTPFQYQPAEKTLSLPLRAHAPACACPNDDVAPSSDETYGRLKVRQLPYGSSVLVPTMQANDTCSGVTGLHDFIGVTFG